MAVDPFSPIAPARVRVLCLPAGRIKKRRFMTLVGRLQQECTVRLGDISPDGGHDGHEGHMFSPLAFPNGALLLNFTTSVPSASSLALAPFELSRDPMLVVGIADAEEYVNGGEKPQDDDDARKKELADISARLKEQYPKILLHQLLFMDCPLPPLADRASWIPETAIVVSSSSSKASKSTHIKSALCSLCARFLSALVTYATAMQALPSVQSPGGTSASASASTSASVRQRQRQISLPVPMSGTNTGIGSNATKAGAGDDSSIATRPATRTESPSSNGHVRAGPPSVRRPATSFDEIANAAMVGPNISRSDSASSGRETPKLRTHSRDRSSIHSSSEAKQRQIGKARVGIVIGNLHMMAGQWSDAWKELIENTNRLRMAGEWLWTAKGYESILTCMLLLIWAGYDFQIPSFFLQGPDKPAPLNAPGGIKAVQDSLSNTDNVAAEITARKLGSVLDELVPMILGLYERASASVGESLPALVYSESVIRLTRLQASVLSADGKLDASVVRLLIRGGVLTPPKPSSIDPSKLYRSTIASMVLQAYPPPDAGVHLSDTIRILSGIITVLSMLGFERKKAVMTKELIALLVPALVQARKIGAAEMGIHPAASLSTAFGIDMADWHHRGLDVVLKEMYHTYGVRDRNGQLSIPTNGIETEETDLEDLVGSAINAATHFSASQTFGSTNLKIDILRACIDFCESLPDLPGIVHFLTLLLRTAGPQGALDPTVRKRSVRLTMDEQNLLMTKMTRTVEAASKAGLPPIQAPYWDDFLVRNLRWVDHGDSEQLREHQKSDLQSHTHGRPRTPFLYDPYAKQIEVKSKEKVLVVGEADEIVITLQNPYDFAIRIEKLDLVGESPEGAAVEVESRTRVLGPARMQNIPFNIKATKPGKVNFVGCLATVFGCKEQLFPICEGSWRTSLPIKVRLTSSAERAAALHGRIDRHSLRVPVLASLSATIIEAQPIVVIDSVGLSEAALMVLEGEKKTFPVTLRNTSPDVTVDFLHVSFEDSLSTSIRTALASKDLSRAEIHELETQLTRIPTFTWARADGKPRDSSIEPGGKATFDITVVGKPGLNTAKVMFDYAYLGTPVSAIEGRTYTRQLAVPIDITVNASIQLHGVNLSELPSDFAWSNQHRKRLDTTQNTAQKDELSSLPSDKSSSRFRPLLERAGLEAEQKESVLMLLDLRNAWPNPLTVNVSVREDASIRTDGNINHIPSDEPIETNTECDRKYDVQETIHPGHVARLVLLVPKIYIENPYAHLPISPQSQRQFILSADQSYTAETERYTRAAFWHREALLEHLHGTWTEDGSGRNGAIDLRALRLSARMIETLEMPDIDLRIRCVPAGSSSNMEESALDQTGAARYAVQPETFITVRSTVHNRSSQPISAMLRLQPTLSGQSSSDAARDVSRKLMISGLLQQALPIVPPGDSVSADLGVVPLVCGEFEIDGLVEEMRVSGEVGADAEDGEDFEAGAGLRVRERRAWGSKETCVLVVGEEYAGGQGSWGQM